MNLINKYQESTLTLSCRKVVEGEVIKPNNQRMTYINKNLQKINLMWQVKRNSLTMKSALFSGKILQTAD